MSPNKFRNENRLSSILPPTTIWPGLGDHDYKNKYARPASDTIQWMTNKTDASIPAVCFDHLVRCVAMAFLIAPSESGKLS